MAADVDLRIVGSVDHLPAFSVTPPGVLVLTRHWDGDGDAWLTVKRADPEVRFSDELLTEFVNGGDNDGMYPDVRLELGEHLLDGHLSPASRTRHCFHGCLLHIDARDRHIVYRICEWVPDAGRGNWIARWPY
jgi:hypothetical protein